MLYTLLFDHEENLVAAAKTCDQWVMGDRYWSEAYPVEVDFENCESATLEIENPLLQYMLDEFPTHPDRQEVCEIFVDQIVFSTPKNPPSISGADSDRAKAA